MIILSLNMIKNIIYNNNKSNNTQLAYIGLEPKSSHTIKYSEPLELVLFHVTSINIKCHKGSNYPHLLFNYLINFLGSYIPFTLKVFVLEK